ncbi:YjcZ family sporulation protein [Bacillus carboniphilus]|uniref:YjcZ family sporulation protein n=1 Tax=Bacillus carboniphilus TaxID=86663 RepID=UPI00353189E9
MSIHICPYPIHYSRRSHKSKGSSDRLMYNPYGHYEYPYAYSISERYGKTFVLIVVLFILLVIIGFTILS